MTEKDFNKIKTNDYCPFLTKLNIKEHKKLVEVANYNKDKIYELREKDSDTGNFGILDTIKIEQLVIADKRTYEGQFIKFFKTKFLSSLSTNGIRIFVYIADNLELNNNKIILDKTKIALECKIVETRKIYDGLNELIEKNIIAKHTIENVFYVNPSIIFRGSNRRVLFTHKNY